MNREYIGDSVYVEIENGMIRLSTNNGGEDSNVIFLETEVFNALLSWYQRVTGQKPC